MKRIAIIASVVSGIFLVSSMVVDAQSLNRGNFVVFKDSANRLFVKTIVAVPGDTVVVSAGRIVVNGIPASVAVDATDEWSGPQIPAQYYMVAGDPLQVDSNGHRLGFVPAANIIGTIPPKR
jgi:signal peptidase I